MSKNYIYGHHEGRQCVDLETLHAVEAENAKLQAVADAAWSVSKEYPEIARRHGLGQALAALDAPDRVAALEGECCAYPAYVGSTCRMCGDLVK